MGYMACPVEAHEDARIVSDDVEYSAATTTQEEDPFLLKRPLLLSNIHRTALRPVKQHTHRDTTSSKYK